MTCTYIKKFSSDISQVKSREFEIDIIGDPKKINYNLLGSQVENIGNRIISIP